MPRFTFSDSEPEEGDVIPDGIYLAEVYNIEEKENKAGNGYNWWWRARITGGPYEGTEPFPLITATQGKGAFKLRPTLRAVGLPYKGNFDLEAEDINALAPLACGIEVAADTYQGKKSSKVVSIISVAEAATSLSAQGENTQVEIVI